MRILKKYIHTDTLELIPRSIGIFDLESKNAQGIFVLSTDITKVKELEISQRIIKNNLESAINTWEWNVQTGDVTSNERWAEKIGYTVP